MRKIWFLSLVAGIALVSIFATCHAMSQNEAKKIGSATQHPFKYFTALPDVSEDCCLLASHDVLVSFLASASGRSNTLYLMGALAAFFIFLRLKGKDQDTNQRVPFNRGKDSFVFRYLQESFARGIIQPRIYEPAFV